MGVMNRLILLWKRSHARPLRDLGFSTKSLLSSGAYGATFFQRKKAILAAPISPRTVISTEVEKSPFSTAQAESGPEISGLRVSIELKTFALISTCSSARDDNSENSLLAF